MKLDLFEGIPDLTPMLTSEDLTNCTGANVHAHNLHEVPTMMSMDTQQSNEMMINEQTKFNNNVQHQSISGPPNTILDQPTEIRIRNYCKRAHNQPLQPMCITNCEKVQKNHTLLFMHNGGAPAWICISVEMKQSDQQNVARSKVKKEISNSNSNANSNANKKDKSAAPQLFINGKNGPTSFDEFILSSKGDFHKVELQPKYSKFEGNKRPSFIITIAINGAVVFSWESVVYHRSTRVKYSTNIQELSFKSEHWNGERFNSSLIPLSNTPLTTEVGSTYLDFNNMNSFL